MFEMDADTMQKLQGLVILLEVMKSAAHKNNRKQLEGARKEFQDLLRKIENNIDKDTFRTLDLARNGYANSFQKFRNEEKAAKLREKELKLGDENLEKLKHLVPGIKKSGAMLFLFIIALALLIFFFIRNL